MASMAGAWRTIAARGAAAAVCGVTVFVAASCGGNGSTSGNKPASGNSHSPVAAPVVTITPATGARHVRPDLPIRILAQDGHLTDVTVRTAGRDVAGRMNPEANQWMSRWALTPGAR